MKKYVAVLIFSIVFCGQAMAGGAKLAGKVPGTGNDMYMAEGKDGMKNFAFKPYLKKDNETLKRAMYAAVEYVYGKERIADMTPLVITKNGARIIMLKGVRERFMFLLVKEKGTEKAIGFALWREQ